MAGAAEYGELESRCGRMTDAELIDALDHPPDFEPWALELFRAELARRGRTAEEQAELREENAVQAAADEAARPTAGRVAGEYFLHHVMVLVGLVAFPAYFWMARKSERSGDVRWAKRLRFYGSMVLLFYVIAALGIGMDLWSRAH